MRLVLVLASTVKKQHFLPSCIVMSNTYLLVDQTQPWGVFQFFLEKRPESIKNSRFGLAVFVSRNRNQICIR